MAKTITQLPPASTVTATTVLPADNAAATATEKVTVAQIVGLAPVQAVAGRTGNVALAVADIGGLQTALDGKQPAGAYAAIVHTHTAAEITDFSSAAQAAVTNASLLTAGILDADRLAASGVAAGTYTSVTVDQKGRVTAGSNPSPAALPAATASVMGGVKIGANVTVAVDGTISVAAPYSLPVATASALGGIKQGDNVTIDGSGVLTANAPSFDSITAKPTTLAGYGITDAPAAAKVDVYTTSGTWTKPAGAKVVVIHAIGGGGGGGGGANKNAGTIAGGGGGGGGAGRTVAWLDASLFPSSVPVTIGAGGLGGTGGTGTANGTDGTGGGTSLFGTNITTAWCWAFGGGRGFGGSTGGGLGGTPQGMFMGSPGAAGAANNSAGGAATATGGGGGGGGGGGVTSTSQATLWSTGGPAQGGYGHAIPSAAGQNGFDVPANAPLAGTGANGGAGVVSGNGGAGGTGGRYGSGGGGGGGCTGSTFRAGAGGAGAQGIVVVMTFF